MNRFATAAAVVLALGLAVAQPPLAGEPEEVVLRSGHVGRAEVVETTMDTVTLKGMKSGVEVTVKMKAADLEAESFYGIRDRHMESTVENHVRLAVFAAENGMLHRARYQMEAAEALDPEVEQKLLDRPDLLEKIGGRVLEGAKRMAAAGNTQVALDMLARIQARLPDTKAAAEAATLVEKLDAEMAAKCASEAEARAEANIAAAAKAGAEEAARMEKVMAPLAKAHEAQLKSMTAARKEKAPGQSIGHYEAAGEKGEALLKAIVEAREGAGASLEAALDGLSTAVRSDTVDAWLGAGNVEFGRNLQSSAEKFARRGLAVDPDSARAQAFLSQVEAASVMEDDFNRRFNDKGQRRRGGGGGGGGRGR